MQESLKTKKKQTKVKKTIRKNTEDTHNVESILNNSQNAINPFETKMQEQ